METNFQKRFFIITLILVSVIGVLVYVSFKETIAAIAVSVLVLLVSFAYLKYTKQFELFLNFKWKKIESWFLNIVIGAIALSWLVPFSYSLFTFNCDKNFKNDKEEITKGQRNGFSVVSDTIVQNDLVSSKNELIVSADKMDVVYRGLPNPLTIKYTGIPSNKVIASANGLEKVSEDSYILRPTSGSTVTVKVSGVLSNGNEVSDSKTFKIKDIPRPMATIIGSSGLINLPKAILYKLSVMATLTNFDFDLNLEVTSFTIMVSGMAPVRVNGSKMDIKARRALMRARRGQIITIYDISAVIEGNPDYKLEKAYPISIRITN